MLLSHQLATCVSCPRHVCQFASYSCCVLLTLQSCNGNDVSNVLRFVLADDCADDHADGRNEGEGSHINYVPIKWG